MPICDFAGWATRNDLLCGDGRIIKRDAFAHNDGKTVSLVWNHQHDDPEAVLGHALLENRPEGVYAYCTFNSTASGNKCKELVQHGDVRSLSIYANKLKQNGREVIHGEIRELSLVLAGANPGANIEFVSENMAHSADGEPIYDACYARYDENIIIHADTPKSVEKEEPPVATEKTTTATDDKTIGEVIDSMTPEQRDVMNYLVGMALNKNKPKEDNEMNHNVFENDTAQSNNYLSHADQEQILELAKSSGVGSFKDAFEIFCEQNNLQHDAFDADDMESLLPEYQLIGPKEPNILWPDDTWVPTVMNGVHKTPFTRLRTRQATARQNELKARGYKKGDKKNVIGKIKLLSRTTDAQTVYVKDALNRDDILDITDFDVVNYQWNILRHVMDQTLATAILVGDSRDDIDPDKIKEDRIRPIWLDDDLYTIHYDVDFAGMKAKLQGSDTSTYFGDEFIKTEALVAASLNSRKDYKGSGNLVMFCSPTLLNEMLLSRDRNGYRMYKNEAELATALNVKSIHTVEQFDGLVRTTDDNKKKKLLSLMVNLSDYQLGCVKGGQITKFENFDIDFNQHKMLLETRVAGSLVDWYSAIALEEDVTAGS